jgi:hypothetical protein
LKRVAFFVKATGPLVVAGVELRERSEHGAKANRNPTERRLDSFAHDAEPEAIFRSARTSATQCAM